MVGFRRHVPFESQESCNRGNESGGGVWGSGGRFLRNAGWEGAFGGWSGHGRQRGPMVFSFAELEPGKGGDQERAWREWRQLVPGDHKAIVGVIVVPDEYRKNKGVEKSCLKFDLTNLLREENEEKLLAKRSFHGPSNSGFQKHVQKISSNDSHPSVSGSSGHRYNDSNADWNLISQIFLSKLSSASAQISRTCSSTIPRKMHKQGRYDMRVLEGEEGDEVEEYLLPKIDKKK